MDRRTKEKERLRKKLARSNVDKPSIVRLLPNSDATKIGISDVQELSKKSSGDIHVAMTPCSLMEKYFDDQRVRNKQFKEHNPKVFESIIESRKFVNKSDKNDSEATLTKRNSTKNKTSSGNNKEDKQKARIRKRHWRSTRDEEQKQKDLEKDRLGKRKFRTTCDNRRKEAEKATPARKKEEAVKQKEAERETPARKEKRQNPVVKEKEVERETPARKDKRQNPAVKEKEAERETPARKEKRQNPAVKEKETERETPARKEKRQNPAVKEKEAERETPARKEKRQNQAVKRKEVKRDTSARNLNRQDPAVKQKEAERETPARKEKRQNPAVKGKEVKRDTSARKLNRQDRAVKLKEAERETPARKEKRQDLEVKQKEAERETPAKKEKRQDPAVRRKEVKRDTSARKEKRQDPAVQHREAARETPRRQAKRTPNLNVCESIEKFKEEIQHGPTYICTCCNRLLRKTAVVLYTEKKFLEQVDLIETCRTSTFSADDKEYICSTCKTSILKGEVPALAVVNGLQLDEVPQTLADLNELESTFVARRIEFMKLLALPRGKQKAVHGCVVNVPVEPEKAVSILPRVSSPETMIPVKLKRKLQYRGHSIMQNIRPKAITDALYMLKYTLKNSLYEGVHINEHWIDDSQQQDPELWNALTGTPDVVTASGNGSVESDNGEHDDDEEENTEDERSRLSGLPFDTCLQPKDVSPSSNLILSVAPGVGPIFRGDELPMSVSHRKIWVLPQTPKKCQFKEIFPEQNAAL